jgi:hypothetical protein
VEGQERWLEILQRPEASTAARAKSRPPALRRWDRREGGRDGAGRGAAAGEAATSWGDCGHRGEVTDAAAAGAKSLALPSVAGIA